jgi:hypothetical protein
VYEEVLPSGQQNMANNIIIGGLQATVKGFAKLKNANGEVELLKQQKATAYYAIKAGADWIDPAITAVIEKKKYTVLAKKEVGPVWMKQ